MVTKAQEQIDHIGCIHTFESGSELSLCLITPNNKPQSCNVALGVFSKDSEGLATQLQGVVILRPPMLGNSGSIEQSIEALIDSEHKHQAQDAIGRFDQLKDELGSKLWELLGDIPVNEYDEIEIDFAGFSAQTPREDIWHWFDKQFDLSVAQRMGMAQ